MLEKVRVPSREKFPVFLRHVCSPRAWLSEGKVCPRALGTLENTPAPRARSKVTNSLFSFRTVFVLRLRGDHVVGTPVWRRPCSKASCPFSHISVSCAPRPEPPAPSPWDAGGLGPRMEARSNPAAPGALWTPHGRVRGWGGGRTLGTWRTLAELQNPTAWPREAVFQGSPRKQTPKEGFGWERCVGRWSRERGRV